METEREQLRWGNPPSGIYSSPIYLGLQTGSFSCPDIEIYSKDNLTGADYTEALVEGSYDMGHMGTPPLFAALQRTDEYVIVGQGVLKYPAFYLVAHPSISTIGDLLDKDVALNKFRTCPHSIVRTLLRQEGMNEDEVRLFEASDAPSMVEAIKNGKTAAAVLWEPYVSHVVRVYGWHVLAEGQQVILPPDYGFMLYARRAFAAAKPEIVKHVVAAYGQSVRAAQQNLPAAVTATKQYMPQIPVEDLKASLDREAAYWSSDTAIDEKLLSDVLAELKLQAVIPYDFQVRQFIP